MQKPVSLSLFPGWEYRLFLCLSLFLSSAGLAAQSCRTEAEIPSSTPTSDFTDNGDGTVTHHKTGLMWMKCPLGQSGADCATGSASTYIWQGALEAASASTFAGHSDWRLPNIKELRSIVENRCVSPAINASVFPATPASYFWSSSPYAGNSSSAWSVNFGSGSAFNYGRNGNYRVRLVRSGQ